MENCHNMALIIPFLLDLKEKSNDRGVSLTITQMQWLS